MKLCNAEIMKKVKLMEQEKNEITAEEKRICQTTYQSATDKIDNGYNFTKTRDNISGLDSEIRQLKHLLNHSNATTVVGDFNMTLGECLVYMAQLNNERGILEQLAQKEATTRHSTFNGVIEYTELNYDKSECKERLKQTQETIAKLQIAIDRTNLTNMIEIE